MAQHDRLDYTARPGEAVRVAYAADGNFAIGTGRVRVVAPEDDAAFVSAVVEDLGRIAHRREGEEALRLGDAIGKSIVIMKPATPTSPPNAWIVPEDLAAAIATAVSVRVDGRMVQGTGAGCGSMIAYNPADWPESADGDLPSRTGVLLTLIEQANANAAGRSNPLLSDWGVRLRA